MMKDDSSDQIFQCLKHKKLKHIDNKKGIIYVYKGTDLPDGFPKFVAF